MKQNENNQEITFALAQMEVIPNNPSKNVETMLNYIREAKTKNVDLIVFPELCISGYLLGDKWLEDSYVNDLMEYNEVLREASEDIAIAYGNIYVSDEKDHPNKDGRKRKYNAAYVYQNKKLVSRSQEISFLPKGVQPKTHLPNYRFFDDGRYFFSLKDVARDYSLELSSILQPFELEFDGKKTLVGFEICEDLWYEDYKEDGKGINVSKHLIDNGAKYIFNLSASPWTYKKNQARDKRIELVKYDVKETFVPFFYVNNVGVQNNGKNFITFDGGSTVYNTQGKPILFKTLSRRTSYYFK
jgi:NAD+ synthase (glutamine-hydrolysing)